MTEILAVMGALGVVVLVFGTPPLQRERMARRLEPYLTGLNGRPSRLTAPVTRREPAIGTWIHRHLRRSGDEVSDLETRLDRADKAVSPAEFRIEQLMWGLASSGIGGGAMLVLTAAGDVDPWQLFILAAVMFWFGFLCRDRWLTAEIDRLHSRIREELPTAIDLVTLSIMSGESIPAAFARVAETLRGGIGVEFGRVVADARAGAPIVEALEALGERVSDPGVSRFVDAICMAIERGSPLADTLRAQATDGRESRRRHMIELGGRHEVLMLVPVVFLIMPVVIVFALLPGLVSLDLLVP